jgi:integrase
MPKRRINELVRCPHFAWRLNMRDGTWYADGRSNPTNAGRHSLGTSDRAIALQLLPELDRTRAEELGLIARSERTESAVRALLLADGRKLYEAHIARPRVTGGVRKSTSKRYRTTLDKFLEFAISFGVMTWNGVTAEVLTAYAEHLETAGYAYKTQVNELTTLKQAIRWMIAAKHLTGTSPIELKLRKAESESAYCYRPEEIATMVAHCRAAASLSWLADVLVGLACTGLRIAEFASLRWADLDINAKQLTIKDETGQPVKADRQRRELKSGRSRSFPIHADLLAVLRRLPHIDQHVFHGPRGGRLKPDTVRRVFVREVIEPLADRFPAGDGEKGFADGRLHSFRHAFCSTCANSGVPVRVVMAWLGHKDSGMINTYYHLHDAESRRQMDQLDFLGGAGGRAAGDGAQTT